MKKHAVAATWVLAVSLVALFTTIDTAEANTPLLARSLSLAGLASELKTPDTIAKYMWRHFMFEKDQRQFGTEEYWQRPEEFLQTGKGDCEDFALFAQAMLKRNGISSFLLNIYGDRGGHTVCVFEENGTYNVIDGFNVKRLKARSLQEAAGKINPFWKSGAVVSIAPGSHEGIILKQFSK